MDCPATLMFVGTSRMLKSIFRSSLFWAFFGGLVFFLECVRDCNMLNISSTPWSVKVTILVLSTFGSISGGALFFLY